MSSQAKILRTFLHYNIETGNLVWKERPDELNFNSRFAGKIAGTLTSAGYVSIGIDLGDGHKMYQAHRLVWLHQKGEWPKHHIDHIDRNRLNNRIENLADVPPALNNTNKKHRIGRSGIKGVHYSNTYNKWQAQVVHNGKKIHFGTFDTAEEAAKAYEEGISKISGPIVPQKTKMKNRKDEPVLTQTELKRQYHYDPETGYFFKIYKNRIDNVPAGHSSGDYRRISVNSIRYQAHHLAILYMTGEFPDPDKDVDHLDRNKDNNAFHNLRQVSRSINAMNRKSKNGEMRGVRRSRNKREGWEARLRIGNKLHQIGTFDTQEEAKEAWLKFAREHHGADLNT